MPTLDKVMIGLSMMAGGHYQRIGALIGGVHQTTVSKTLVNFSKAVNEVIRPQVLHMPTTEKMWENARNLEDKYHLPGFAFGVDGILLNFDGKPYMYVYFVLIVTKMHIIKLICIKTGVIMSHPVETDARGIY